MENENQNAGIPRDGIVRDPQHVELLNRNRIEVFMWLALAVFALSPLLRDIYTYVVMSTYRVSEQIYNNYYSILFAFFIILAPFIYKLIFGNFPLQAIRLAIADSRFSEEMTQDGLRHLGSGSPRAVGSASGARGAAVLEFAGMANSSALELFSCYSLSSRNLSKNLYGRAGVYLLTGVFCAFSGLGFFYLQTGQLSGKEGMAGIPLLLALVPKFGILFFIELIAFFFLRQYRSAMDEFRYYEEIKRKREETLALLRIVKESGGMWDVDRLVASGAFFSKQTALQKDQTTEIIESRKLEKNEIALLEKMIEVIARTKDGG